MSRKKIVGWCSVEGCQRPLKNLGLCQFHYLKKWRAENPSKAKGKLRAHPYYHLWYERKQNEQLCDEWLDFEAFILGVGEKPEGEFVLARSKEGLFGPDNFEWREHLRRRPDEPLKDWWARKLENRKRLNPNLESDRNIKRKFGLTRQDYNAKLEAQNYVCAICEEQETRLDNKSNSLLRLSVDHCHATGKLRDLLCWRCNTTIGRVEESIELLGKMIDYLNKHKE